MKITETCAWNNTHYNDPISNLATAPQLEDGCYIQLFAVKDGVRYDVKIISTKEMATTLTSSLMDGVEKLLSL